MPGGYTDVTGYTQEQHWERGVVKCQLDCMIATPGAPGTDVGSAGPVGSAEFIFRSDVYVGSAPNWDTIGRWYETFSLQDYYDVINGDSSGTWMTPDEFYLAMDPENPTPPTGIFEQLAYDGNLEFFVMNSLHGRWAWIGGFNPSDPTPYLKHKRAMAFINRCLPVFWPASTGGFGPGSDGSLILPFPVTVARSTIDGYIFPAGSQEITDRYIDQAAGGLAACPSPNVRNLEYSRFNVTADGIIKYYRHTVINGVVLPSPQSSPTKTTEFKRWHAAQNIFYNHLSEVFLGQPWNATDPVIGLFDDYAVPGFTIQQANVANALWEFSYLHDLRYIMSAHVVGTACESTPPPTEDKTILARSLDALVDKMVTIREAIASWRNNWKDLRILVTDQEVPGDELADIDFGDHIDSDRTIVGAHSVHDNAQRYLLEGWSMTLARDYSGNSYGAWDFFPPVVLGTSPALVRIWGVMGCKPAGVTAWSVVGGSVPPDTLPSGALVAQPNNYGDTGPYVVATDSTMPSSPPEVVVFDFTSVVNGYQYSPYAKATWDPSCCNPTTTGRTLLWIDPLCPASQVDPDGTYASRYRSRSGENLFRADFLHSFAGNGTSSGGPFLSLSEVSPGLGDSMTFLKAASQADPSIWRYPIRMFILPSVYGSNAPTPEPKTRAHFYASGTGYWPTEDEPEPDPFFVLPYRGIEKWAAAIKKGIEDGTMAKDTFDQQDEGCLLIIYVRDGLTGDQVIGRASPWFASELSRYDTIYRRPLTLARDTAAETRSRGGVMAAEMSGLMSNQKGHPANIVISVYDGTGPSYYKFVDWNFIRSKNKQDIFGGLRAGNRVSYSVPEDLGLIDATVRTYLNECFNKWLPEVWQSANVDNKVGLQAGSWNW